MGNSYWFAYTTVTGEIYWTPQLAPANPWPNPPASLTVVGYDQATASTDVVMASQFPARYLMQGDPVVPELQPYWSVAAAESAQTAGLYAVTATLAGPAMQTPPTEATFTVAGATYTEAVTNGTASLAIQVHSTIQGQSVTVQVSGTGVVDGSVTIGSSAASIGQQSWTDAVGTNWVGPGGAGSRDYVMGYNAAQVPQAQQVNALAVAVGELLHVTHDIVLPALQQAAYAPITLSADETNALNDITAGVLPDIVTTLSAIYPSGGAEMPVYTQMKAALATAQTAIQNTNTGLSEIPNLQ